MRILIVFALALSAFGQSELSRSRFVVLPKGDSSDVGDIAFGEIFTQGTSRIYLKGLPALPSDKTLFLPSANVSTSLLGANTLNFAAVAWTVNRAGGTEASPTALANGDGLLSITPQMYNGSAYVDGGSISFTGLLTASTYHSRFQISTRDNTGAVATRLLIDSNLITTLSTSLNPGASASYSLGSTGLRWLNTFTDGLTVSNGAGQGVTADLIPNSDRVRSLGSAALPQMWANLYIGNGAVQIYGATSQIRGSYSGGGITISDAAGATTFSVASTSGNTVVNDLTINGTCTGCGVASPPLDLHLDSSANYVVTLGTHDTTSRQLRFQHSRSTHASPTDSVSGDLIGLLSAELYGGGAYRTAAQILIHAVGTPSSTSSPGQITLCTTPPGSTACTERVAVTPFGTLNVWSNFAGSFLARFQNDAADGFSGFRMMDNGSNVKASVAWGNSSSGIPSTFHIGTQSSDTVTLITGSTSRWTLGAADGNLLPATDGGPTIGNSTFKPLSIWSRTFNTYTANGVGLQESGFSADNDVNITITAFNSALSTSRSALSLRRARNTLGSPTAVSSGDRIGIVAFSGFSNGGFNLSSMIEGIVDASPSGSTVPGSLQFYTTDTGGTFANRMEILASGDVNMNHGLTVTNTVNATGSPAYRVSGQTVIDASRNLTTAGINPITGATYDIGSGSSPYNTIAGTTLQTYTSGAVLRFQAAGTITLRNAASALVFEVSNTGVVSSNGSSGISATLSVRDAGGGADCTITITGGIVTASTC